MIRNGVPNSQIKKGDIIAFNSKEGLMKVFNPESARPIYWEHIGPDDKYFIGNIDNFLAAVGIIGDALGHLKPRRIRLEQDGWDTAFIFE